MMEGINYQPNEKLLN